MRHKYKVQLHIKNYVKKELYDYKKNKNKLNEIQLNDTSSQALLIIIQRIQRIEKVYNSLSREEQKITEKIFFEKCNQPYMETNYYISKDMYYNNMNKTIYLVAIELELM